MRGISRILFNMYTLETLATLLRILENHHDDSTPTPLLCAELKQGIRIRKKKRWEIFFQRQQWRKNEKLDFFLVDITCSVNNFFSESFLKKKKEKHT